MSNQDKRRKIVSGILPITRHSDGSERYFYETGDIESKSMGDFLIKPCLSLCTHYRRSTGAFGKSALITVAKLAERIRASLLRHHSPQLSFEDVQLYLDNIEECPNDVVSHIIYNES